MKKIKIYIFLPLIYIAVSIVIDFLFSDMQTAKEYFIDFLVYSAIFYSVILIASLISFLWKIYKH